MSTRQFLRERTIVVAILLLSVVGIAGGSCAHNSPAPKTRSVDFLGAQRARRRLPNLPHGRADTRLQRARRCLADPDECGAGNSGDYHVG
jgi:hypothetical protein